MSTSSGGTGRHKQEVANLPGRMDNLPEEKAHQGSSRQGDQGRLAPEQHGAGISSFGLQTSSKRAIIMGSHYNNNTMSVSGPQSRNQSLGQNTVLSSANIEQQGKLKSPPGTAFRPIYD